MKFVSSLFLVLLLSVSVTARKRLTRGNIRDLDEGRRLGMSNGKGSKKSEAPSSAPSDSKMSKGKGSKNLISDTDDRRRLGGSKGKELVPPPSATASARSRAAGRGRLAAALRRAGAARRWAHTR